MLSSRPYLLRAVHDWIVDSGMTPHLIADGGHPELVAPASALQDGRVVLNIGPSAVRDLLIDADLVTFVARFGGVSQAVTVPMLAVQAIYARENGRGMMFPDDENGEESGRADGEPGDGDEPGSGRSRPNLRVVK